MSSKIFSATTVGLDAQLIEVECDYGGGGEAGKMIIVGLPDTAIQEAKMRVWSALRNSGFGLPRHFTTINLAPADLKKQGPAYDLPIALSYLLDSGELAFDDTLKNSLFIGELALNGDLRPVNGILPISLLVRQKNFSYFFVPEKNTHEASLIPDIKVIPIKSLKQLVLFLQKKISLAPFVQPTPIEPANQEYAVDFCHIKGQEQAKRALEIASAGGHNILMSGPPGSGKSLLASALPSILPKMSVEESLEVTKIYSIAGQLSREKPLIKDRPFRSPHHSASGAALVGGGAWPKPGEISLAHRGVLFLDEFPEFPRHILENLRQPLEDGVISISRAQGCLKFPARFILVAAMNPCPCGYKSDPDRQCHCSANQIINYQKKISGPLLDRIDLHIEVARLDFDKLESDLISDYSANIRQRISLARQKQIERFKDDKIITNSEMSSHLVKKYCPLGEAEKQLLRQATQVMHLSARSFFRILKVAKTITDLAGRENININDLAEAIHYRPEVE